MTLKTINLALNKSQISYLQLRQEVLYSLFTGGVGSGKSHVASVAIVLDMMENPNAIIGVFAPTVAHVRDILMRYVIKRLEEFGFRRDQDFTVNKNEMKILPNHPDLCEVWFKSLDEPDSIVGYEFFKSHIDEIDVIARMFGVEKAERAWENVQARTRQWPDNLDMKYMCWNDETQQYEPRNTISAYSTPEGFKFTYKLWGKNTPGCDNYNPQYAYISAKSKDNPKLPMDYIKQLEKKYSGPRAKAYLEGEWVNLESGTVYYAYNRIEHNSKETIQPNETLFVGMDFNVGHMSGRVFVKRHKATGEQWHCVAEIDDLLDTPDIINAIQIRWQTQGHRIVVYPDSTGRNRTATNASLGNIMLLKAAKFDVRARDKNPLVVDRVADVNRAFIERRLFVNANECPKTAEYLEQQAYDKSGRPDKAYHGDHGNDAFGYPVSYELGMRAQVYAIPIKFATKR